MRSNFRIALSIASLLVLCACEYSEPARDELIGTWTDARSGAVLTLDKSGAMMLRNWPYRFIDGGHSDGTRRVSAVGRWQWIDYHEKPKIFDEDNYYLDLTTSEIDGRLVVREVIPNFGHDFTGIEITRWYGDPDEGDALRFEKTTR